MSTAVDQVPDHLDEFSRAEQAAEHILRITRLRPKIAVVLGSGLGGFADDLQDATSTPYSSIPHFARSTAIGHAGKLVIGKAAGLPIAAMQGRTHQYEGYSAKEVSFPIRVFGRMGVKAVILTNAAGGIHADYGQGALVMVRDHINLQGTNPLSGPNDERFGLRFIDMTEAYSKRFREITREEAKRLEIPIHEGVYAALAGPSFETPAEIRYLKIIGADLVGMSTVPEVIVARHMGLQVLAISCVTNMAAGLSGQLINHEEVLETGARVRGIFLALLGAVIPRIEKEL